MSEYFEIPPEDQEAWARFLGISDALPVSYSYTCDQCHMPVTRDRGRWRHTEAADSAFCALIFGTTEGPAS